MVSHDKFANGHDLCEHLFVELKSLIDAAERNNAENLSSIGQKTKFAFVYHQKNKIRVYLKCRENDGQTLQSMLPDALILQKRHTMSSAWAQTTPYFIDLASDTDAKASAPMIAHVARRLGLGEWTSHGAAREPIDGNDRALRVDISRLVKLIREDVKRAGDELVGVYPVRSAPEEDRLFNALMGKWHDQDGLCALCGGVIPLKPNNRLFQMSRDRADSAVKVYDATNLQLTHLGCNLAKNDATLAEWQVFLAMLREDHVEANESVPAVPPKVKDW